MSKVAQESQSSFKRTAKPKAYLQSRSLAPPQLAVGYISQDFGKSWNTALQQSAIALGLLKKSLKGSLQSKFKQCVVFFLKNAKGQVVGVYGRSVNENTELKHLYLNGKHQGLYPGYPKEGTTQLILTESIIDCATLEAQEEINQHYGLLALYGTNGFTPDHTEAVSQLEELQEIILFFDGDEAGKAAIEKTTAKLQQIRTGIKITAVPTPEGEDINSLQQGHPDKSGEIFTHLLQQRKPIHAQKESSEQQSLPRSNGGTEADPRHDQGTLDTTNADKILYQVRRATLYDMGWY